MVSLFASSTKSIEPHVLPPPGGRAEDAVSEISKKYGAPWPPSPTLSLHLKSGKVLTCPAPQYWNLASGFGAMTNNCWSSCNSRPVGIVPDSVSLQM